MKLVIDSSVAFKWVVLEVDSDSALRLRDDFVSGSHELIAPSIFPIELAHALTRAERQARVNHRQALVLLTEVLQLGLDLHESLALLPRAVELSSSMRIGVYDCLYVALAERESCELVTADSRLVNVLQPTLPFILPLAALP